MSYTDNDYINLEYEGKLMPNITISEQDKSQTDRLFIDWSYAGKILQSDSPVPPGPTPTSGVTFNDEVTLSWDDLKLQANATKYGYSLTDANWTNLSATVTIGGEPMTAGIFTMCSSVVSIILPDSVTSICDYAFYACANLESVDASNSKITSIGSTSFGVDTPGSSKLSSVLLPNNTLTTISGMAFMYCSALTSIALPNTITTIEDGAFVMAGITSVNMPNNLTALGRNVFAYCTSLASVSLESNTLDTIGEGCFQNCSALTTLSIPSNIKTIGYSAFKDCTGITNVTFQEGTTEILGSAFMGCTALEVVILPNSLITIGENLSGQIFSGCTSLNEIHFGNSLTFIGESSFTDCNGLSNGKVYINDISAWCNVEFDSSAGTDKANPLSYSPDLYINDSLTTSIIIPNGVTQLNHPSFNNYTKLIGITLPVTLTNIGGAVIQGCSSLTNITFQGTKSQWQAIAKFNYWDYGSGNYTVHCTDGDLPK